VYNQKKTDITTRNSNPIQKKEREREREREKICSLFVLGAYVCVYVGMCWEENGDSVHVQCITIEELRIYYEQKNIKRRNH